MTINNNYTMKKEQYNKFLQLIMKLEPENLYMDGECSQADARRRERQIKSDWRSLEKEVGFAVTHDYIWARYFREKANV